MALNDDVGDTGAWLLSSFDVKSPILIPPILSPPLTDGFGNIWLYDGDELGDEIVGTDLIMCTLPNGLSQEMPQAACLLAGGMYDGLVVCMLSDGSVERMTPEDCLAANGKFGDNLFDKKGDLENELDSLGGPLSDNDVFLINGGSGLIITSLLNLNRDITLERTTKIKGKRYGFYQSDIE